MAALVQSSSSSILQHRPASATGLLESQSSQAYNKRSSNGHQFQLAPRSISFTGSNSGGNMVGGGYRGIAAAPVAPYAFTSTPTLPQTNNTGNSQSRQQILQSKQETRSVPERSRYPGPPSTSSTVSTTSSSNSSNTPPSFAAIQQEQLRQRQQQHQQQLQPPNNMSRPPNVVTNLPGSQNLSLPATNGAPSPTSMKPSPSRYRHRTDSNNGSNAWQGNGNEVVGGGIYSQPVKANSSPSLPLQHTNLHVSNNTNNRASAQFVGPGTGVGIRPVIVGGGLSIDDIQAQQRSQTRTNMMQQDVANRRKSAGTFDTTMSQSTSSTAARSNTSQPSVQRPKDTTPNAMQLPRPDYSRRESNESSKSGTSSSDSVGKRQPHYQLHPQVATQNAQSGGRTLTHKGSYNDINTRSTQPSPLSRPVNLSPGQAQGQLRKVPSRDEEPSRPSTGRAPENAADRLAALQLDPKQGLKSRLRRAFSFGSAAELRQASNMSHEERIRLRQEREEAEQIKIAEQQEAGGLGNAIYSNNQGNIFSGSTDNLSIQSTASSASVMLRKMGKGMKRSSRSLVGLFRPKSVIGVPPAAGPVNTSSTIGPSMAQVSMVTVEAEREKVNVNADPHSQAGGGTGFPKLERNSIDTARRISNSGQAGDDLFGPRKSFVGGETERAEVLAAVKKGILKHKGSASSIVRPADQMPVNFQLPEIPTVSSQPTSPTGGSLSSSMPSDYFLTPNAKSRYHSPKASISGAISAPVTPSEVEAAKGNVSFNPRITFHDTWPSGEYDRRGETSTCNRLTPMLAQQIKEELNSFKMEMEIHEDSKVYTHFF